MQKYIYKKPFYKKDGFCNLNKLKGILQTRVIILLLLVLAFNILSAQNKIACVDAELLMKRMPETAKADTILKYYQDSLQSEFQTLEEVLNRNTTLSPRNCGAPELSENLKQAKRNEIIALVTKVQNFQLTIMDMVNKKAEELRLQVIKILKDSLKKIADENGYSFVLDLCEDAKFPLPPCYDITDLVITKLGL